MAENKSWWKSFWPYLITACVAIVITLIIVGWGAYAALGMIPLLGGGMQNKVRKKLGFAAKKIISVSRGRGIGSKSRKERKEELK